MIDSLGLPPITYTEWSHEWSSHHRAASGGVFCVECNTIPSLTDMTPSPPLGTYTRKLIDKCGLID